MHDQSYLNRGDVYLQQIENMVQDVDIDLNKGPAGMTFK